MPYAWSGGGAAHDLGPGSALPDGAREALRLWPHRSMTNRGFAVFIGATFALICVPMLAVIGSPVLWALMPFMFGTLALTWMMIRMNDKTLTMSEELVIWEDRVALTRREARGREHRWEANPHWVEVALRADSGPVENYVTLKGNSREVEIGAFLSPDERKALFEELSRRLPAR